MWRRRRKPDEHVVACRDIAGRRHEILVMPTDNQVALVFPNGEVAVLDPLQVGRLRGALRDVVHALDDPATQAEHQQAIPTVRTQE
jgi:hypothetical protein